MQKDWKIVIIFMICVVGLLSGVAVAQYISGSNDGVADGQKHIIKSCKLLPNLDSMYHLFPFHSTWC